MTQHELAYPKKVQIGDITVRDGFQHEEIWIPTDAKLFYLEELILCGIKHLEVTNFGNPALMPQFKDGGRTAEAAQEFEENFPCRHQLERHHAYNRHHQGKGRGSGYNGQKGRMGSGSYIDDGFHG